MSASPGAYLTSLQTGLWYRFGSQYWVLPVVINTAISANTTYGSYVFPVPVLDMLLNNVVDAPLPPVPLYTAIRS